MSKLKTIRQLLNNKLAGFWMRLTSGMQLDRNVSFKGFPDILKHKSAQIIIGENTTINSSNYGYHINMHSSCKLYADRANALIKIGKNTRIHGSCVHAYNEITIGDNCLIAANTHIIDGNGHELSFDDPANRIHTTDNGRPVTIEDNVWIAANCIVLGGTHIGNGAIITAGSIVKGTIPAKSIYGGNPAQLIKQY